MFTLYHHSSCPFCRKTRLVLSENGLDYTLISEEIWKRRPEFLQINVAGEIPVLLEPAGHYLCGHRPICEYINEITSRPLMGIESIERAEIRRLCDWFEVKFYNEVTAYLAGEKIFKRLCRAGSPDSSIIKAGKSNILNHLMYTEWLLQHRKWLAGESFSMADLSAAAQLSVLDYIGEVPWDKADKANQPMFEETKNWYARIKSRPSFKPLLADRLANMVPASHYVDLDF